MKKKPRAPGQSPGRPPGSRNDPSRAIVLPFTQSQMTRALRACMIVNLQIASILVEPNEGRVTITPKS